MSFTDRTIDERSFTVSVSIFFFLRMDILSVTSSNYFFLPLLHLSLECADDVEHCRSCTSSVCARVATAAVVAIFEVYSEVVALAADEFGYVIHCRQHTQIYSL